MNYKISLITILGFSSVFLTNSSWAFQVDFTNWQGTGDFALASNQAQLSTNRLNNDDFPSLDSNFNFSGNPATRTLPADNLEAFVDLSVGQLDGPDFFFDLATEGSAIKQNLTVNAGDVLTFSANFLTNDDDSDGSGFGDHAFLVVDGSLKQILVNVATATLNPASTYAKQTGEQTYTYIFPASGDFPVAIGVVDIGDDRQSSAFVVSNFELTTTAVPFDFSPAPGLILTGIFFSLNYSRRNMLKRLFMDSRNCCQEDS